MACPKTENDKNLFIKVSNCYGALMYFVFSIVSSSDDVHTNMYKHYFICQLVTSKEETFKKETSNLETSALA